MKQIPNEIQVPLLRHQISLGKLILNLYHLPLVFWVDITIDSQQLINDLFDAFEKKQFLFRDSYRDDDDSPMFDERPSHDPSPSTSTTTSARRANSTTTSSNPESSGPSTVPAGAEAAYSLGNPISTIFNQIFGG